MALLLFSVGVGAARHRAGRRYYLSDAVPMTYGTNEGDTFLSAMCSRGKGRKPVKQLFHGEPLPFVWLLEASRPCQHGYRDSPYPCGPQCSGGLVTGRPRGENIVNQQNPFSM